MGTPKSFYDTLLFELLENPQLGGKYRGSIRNSGLMNSKYTGGGRSGPKRDTKASRERANNQVCHVLCPRTFQ